MADLSKKKEPEKDPKSSETMERARLQDRRLQEVHSQLMREKDEPTEGFSPVPMALIFLFAGLSFWAGIYLTEFSGKFDPLVYNENFDPTAVADAEPAAPEPLAVRGERVFQRNCVACHQTSGAGVPGAFPTLVGTQWVLGSEERVTKILLHGLGGPIEVMGNTYNGAMPAFGNQLSDRDIAAVLTYIRQAWGNDAPEINEEFVAAVDADTAGRTATWTADELLAMYPGAD